MRDRIHLGAGAQQLLHDRRIPRGAGLVHGRVAARIRQRQIRPAALNQKCLHIPAHTYREMRIVCPQW